MNWFLPLLPITLLGLFSALAAAFYLRQASVILASRRMNEQTPPGARSESPLRIPH
jgi:hypothetical protein